VTNIKRTGRVNLCKRNLSTFCKKKKETLLELHYVINIRLGIYRVTVESRVKKKFFFSTRYPVFSPSIITRGNADLDFFPVCVCQWTVNKTDRVASDKRSITFVKSCIRWHNKHLVKWNKIEIGVTAAQGRFGLGPGSWNFIFSSRRRPFAHVSTIKIASSARDWCDIPLYRRCLFHERVPRYARSRTRRMLGRHVCK